jgi:uncharacterized lipoprotein YajG
MIISSTFLKVAGRVMLPGALILLAGCQTSQPSISVTSPPPPTIGSAPIAAYDAYAMALKPQVGTPRSEHFILITSR